MEKPHRRDTAAFQLVALLEELDIEVARLQLNPRSRTLLSSGREHMERTRRLCEQIGVPVAAPDDLDTALKALQREIGAADADVDMGPRIAEVRQVTHALRAVCIAIVARNSRI